MISRLFWGIILIVLVHAGIGLPNESPVVIVLHAAKEGGALQLQAELKSVGYRPVMLEHPPKSLTASETDKILATHGAIALINITSEDGRVAVWVSSGEVGGGKLVETIGTNRESISAATILKSVESLRASLMQFGTLKLQTDTSAENKTADQMDKTGPTTKLSKKAPVLFLEIGGGTFYALGRFSPSAQLGGGVVWWLQERFAIYGAPAFPVYPMKTKNAYGEVAVWSGQMVFGIREYLTGYKQRVRPWLGIGAGPSFLRIIGSAGQRGKSAKDLLVTAMLFARAGLLVFLSDRIGLHMTVYSGFSMFWRPHIVVGEEQIPLERPVVVGGNIGITVNLL